MRIFFHWRSFLAWVMLLSLGIFYSSYSSANCFPSTAAVINRAYAFMKQKKWDRAFSLMEKYRKSHKDVCPEFLLYFGNCCVLAGKFKRGVEVLEKYVKTHPTSFEGWNLLASAYYGDKDYARGAKAFLKASGLSSKNKAQCLYYAGVCRYFQGKKEDACKLIKRAIQECKTPRHYQWTKTLLSILFSLKKYREAFPYVVELSSAPIKDRQKWEKIRVQLYFLLGKWSQAHSYLYLLLDRAPLKSMWWDYLFQVYLKENRTREALACLIIKGFITPLSPKDKKMVGDLYLQMDIPLEAVKFYEPIAKNSDFKKLAPLLARCYLRLKKNTKALYWIDRALEIKKNHTLFFLRGVILYQMGKFKDAALSFEKAGRLSKSPGESYLFAGYCAFYAKDFSEARRFFVLASKDKKKRKQALEMLRYIKKLN